MLSSAPKFSFNFNGNNNYVLKMINILKKYEISYPTLNRNRNKKGRLRNENLP